VVWKSRMENPLLRARAGVVFSGQDISRSGLYFRTPGARL
jgi:hypothetical protein